MAKEPKNVPTPDQDYTEFFRNPELTDKYPGVKLPPATFAAHQEKILAFAPGQSLSVVFPVGEAQTNPVGTLQGGILSSFFDDAFGMLCFASLHRPCVTIDLSVNFIRPVETRFVRHHPRDVQGKRAGDPSDLGGGSQRR